ncbi:Hemoglobin and hemoglobin-haptoglobin-binding protein A [Orchesella cincta]|uniref:Hemoglobin and hemoglobin-haptoglobin-binding protein A n=1 Tax=Orchesella cincta TaxID=48709 RepID=A0A1D2MZW2_ORCCI|nr:Hemoglobin and hemoglobin-haptoglobin-binding protein A [Orchesella cincta]
MGFPTVFTLTLISSSIILLLLAGPANGTNFRINLASTLDPEVAWPWPFNDTKANYTTVKVDSAETSDKLLYFVGISLIGQSEEEVKKLDSIRCINTPHLLESFVTLMPNEITPIHVYFKSPSEVTLGSNNESIQLTSSLVNKTYGNARSVPLKAGGETFVLQVMRELAEPGKMDIFILSRSKTIQLERAILAPLTTELSDNYNLHLTYEPCDHDTSKDNNQPTNPPINGGNNQPTNLPTSNDNNQPTNPPTSKNNNQPTNPPEQSTAPPRVEQSTVAPPKTAESSNGYKLQPTSVLIILSISRFL